MEAEAEVASLHHCFLDQSPYYALATESTALAATIVREYMY